MIIQQGKVRYYGRLLEGQAVKQHGRRTTPGPSRRNFVSSNHLLPRNLPSLNWRNFQSPCVIRYGFEGRRVTTLVLPLQEATLTNDKRFVLDQTAAAIEAVQALPHSTARLAVRIAKLDAELADVKIPDRARGLMLKSETVAGFCGRGYFDRDISEAFYSDANLWRSVRSPL